MKTVIKYRFYPSIVVIRKIVTRVCLLASLRSNVMESWKILITLRQIEPHKAQT